MQKSEKSKMLSGEVYDMGNEELMKEYHKGMKLVKKYNSLDSDQIEELNETLKELLGKKGKGVWIGQPFYCHFGYNIEIDDGVQINMNCTFLDHNKITIGKNSGIGPGTQIFTVYHPMDPRERLFERSEDENDDTIHFWKSMSLPVTIGENVWIGGGVIILPGVTIGNNTVIGSGSVVTKSIPENVVAVGNPCKVIKELKK